MPYHLYRIYHHKRLHCLPMALKEGFIPKFTNRRTFDLMMFGWVDCIHTQFSSVSIKKAVEMFRVHYGLEVEEFNEDAACVTYNRMKAELRDYDRERKKS
jgi:hypothetical protein